MDPTLDYQVINKDGIVTTVPDPELDTSEGLGRYIFNACEKYAQNIYQMCSFVNKSQTFEEFKRQSVNLAINLRKLCFIQEGDIIMTCMQNSMENSIPVASTFFLNAVTSSLDPTLSERDCEHLINLIDPKVIIVDGYIASNIISTLKTIGKQTIMIVNTSSGTKPKDCLSLQDLLHFADGADTFQPVIVTDSNSLGTVLFSSGTTGLPKGICLSHKSLFTFQDFFHAYMDYPKVFTFCTTFYWLSGIGLLLSQFNTGSTRVALRKFDVDQFVDVCKKYDVESAFFATSYLSKLLDVQEKVRKVTSLRRISVGGMMPTKGLIAKARNCFPHIKIIQGYGISEAAGGGCTFWAKFRDNCYEYPESIGYPVPGVEIKIKDKTTGKTLGPNQEGIIMIRSKWHMLGYYRNNTDVPFEKDGFLNTGDVGHYDENNLFYISGRCKQMFKYQSWHIVPASIEAVICEHPAVDEVVVFGIPAGDDGHLPSAAITIKQTWPTKVQPKEIANFVAGRVADRQRLRGGVYILAEMPRTPTGKIHTSKLLQLVTNTN